jgi:hypothetical protein
MFFVEYFNFAICLEYFISVFMLSFLFRIALTKYEHTRSIMVIDFETDHISGEE